MGMNESPMTDRQILAFLNPCARAYETTGPSFWQELEYKGLNLSSILTVNKWLDFNGGRPVWHASVAAIDVRHGKTIRSGHLSTGQRKCVIEYAKLLLQGVGALPSAVAQHEYAFHYRRSVSQRELAALPEAWCALPALDAGGTGRVLEINV